MEPCQKRLDANCFRSNPAWARRAFAYRLLHLLTPKQLTRRLPKGLRLALIAPGVDVPPGLVLPDGTLVGPGTTLPSTWDPGDPVPPGIIIIRGTTFPDGWAPEDPPPLGVIIEPGAGFPPDWKPPDPVPEGLYPAPVLPPPAMATGPTPPTYVDPGTPGPVHRPPEAPPAAVSYWFRDPFDEAEVNDWYINATDGATIGMVGDYLRFFSPDGVGHAAYRRIKAETWPTNFTVNIRLAYVQQGTESGVNLRFDSKQIQFYVSYENQLQLQCKTGWVLQDIPGGFDTDFHIYSLRVVGSNCAVDMDGVEKIASCEMPATGATTSIFLTLGHVSGDSEVLYDYIEVIET